MSAQKALGSYEHAYAIEFTPLSCLPVLFPQIFGEQPYKAMIICRTTAGSCSHRYLIRIEQLSSHFLNRTHPLYITLIISQTSIRLASFPLLSFASLHGLTALWRGKLWCYSHSTSTI